MSYLSLLLHESLRVGVSIGLDRLQHVLLLPQLGVVDHNLLLQRGDIHIAGRRLFLSARFLHLPPNQLLVGLALFLTTFIMAPVWKGIHEEALSPYLDNKISQREAIGYAEAKIRSFMFAQTRDKDLGLFIKLAKTEAPKKKADVETYLLIPAFMISELKTAFQIGFLIYVPFLVIDMVVASILMAMGMMMLPPVIISLPFKLILFVLVDGWQLVIGSLVRSFG